MASCQERWLWGALLVACCTACSSPEPATLGSQDGVAHRAAAESSVARARWPGFPLLPDGRFPIAGWCAPPMRENTRARLEEYAEAGFTVLLPALEDPYQEDLNRERLRISRETGLWTIVRDDRVHPDETSRPTWRERLEAVRSAYADSAALLAYFLADEPATDIAGSLATLTRAFAEADSLHPAYVNYLGLSPALQGHYGKTYRGYLEDFVAEVKPAFFSVDLYTLFRDRETPNLCPGLDTARTVAARRCIPFWAVLQLTPHLQFRDLRVSEISYQAMLALAYGAKGVVWFTYWTPRADEWGYRDGPISYQGRRTPAYQRVATVNRSLQSLGRQLAGRAAVAVRHTPPLPVDGLPLDLAWPLHSASGSALTVGFFAASQGSRSLSSRAAGVSDGDTLALLVSRDFRQASTVSLGWRGRAQLWNEERGAWEPYAHDSGPLRLPAGGAHLLRFSPGE